MLLESQKNARSLPLRSIHTTEDCGVPSRLVVLTIAGSASSSSSLTAVERSCMGGDTTFLRPNVRYGKEVVVITRVWRCGIVPARAEELVDWIAENSWPSVRLAPGFEGGALYLPMDGKDKMITVSHWADRESIANYAGTDWQGTPIATSTSASS